MKSLSNRDINLLAAHSVAGTLAWCLSGVFSTAFLLRTGVTPPQIFLAWAAILATRFALRPLVLAVVPMMGLRQGLVLGTFLCGFQFLCLPLVHGIGTGLAVFCAVTALGQVFYCTCYHAVFASLGDADKRGSQIGARQVLAAAAEVVGPLGGGTMLAAFGPWAAFGTAFVLQLGAVVPVLFLAAPPVTRTRPRRPYAEAKIGVQLFFVDGWIQMSSATGWSILIFQAVGERFDHLGGVLSAAALAGAIGGLIIGRLLDTGQTRRMVFLNAVILLGSLMLKAFCVGDDAAMIAVSIGSTALGGFYIPCLMTAVYNEAKRGPSTFDFHFAAEAGWDLGGILASLFSAALCAMIWRTEMTILLAIPAVILQAHLLINSYRGGWRTAKFLEKNTTQAAIEPPA